MSEEALVSLLLLAASVVFCLVIGFLLGSWYG